MVWKPSGTVMPTHLTRAMRRQAVGLDKESEHSAVVSTGRSRPKGLNAKALEENVSLRVLAPGLVMDNGFSNVSLIYIFFSRN